MKTIFLFVVFIVSFTTFAFFIAESKGIIPVGFVLTISTSVVFIMYHDYKHNN